MRGIVDALYWRLHTAYLKNYRQDAERFLAMLDDETGGSADPIEREVGFIHAERLRKIKDRMVSGSFGRIYGDGDGVDLMDLSPPAAKKTCNERDFCRDLLRSKDKFLSTLGIEFWADVVCEVDLAPYGRCDFLVTEGRKTNVIEVKMGESPPAVVSQIDRYRLALELDMCLGLYDEVSAYVLAESFSPYVAGELSRLDVAMVEHKGTPGSLRRIQ